MNTKNLILLLLILGLSSPAFAGGEKTDSQLYIEKWKDVAIAQMQEHGIPASITLAQGILESGNGKSMLSLEANNHFGIKCHNWKGPGVYKDDDKKNECFRKYRSANDSFEDHSEFLKKKRYEFLYDYKITDYKSWARGLKKAGYATDPSYAKRLIRLIEVNELHVYDRVSSSKKTKVKQKTKPRYQQQRVPNTPDKEVIDLTAYRQVLKHPNEIKFVKAKAGDSIEEIAEDLDMAPWQIKRYNDLPTGHNYSGGETVYLQPKRNKSKTAYHLAIEGETLRSISQRYGVKLAKLAKYNSLSIDHALSKNTKVFLQPH